MPDKIIYKVTSVTAKLKFVVTIAPHPSIRLKLSVNAKGLTRTLGWKNGHLVPRIYITPPPNGYMEFEFMATPPPLVSIPVISNITAKEYLSDPPSWIKGVAVYSETNIIKAVVSGPLVSHAQKAVQQAKAAKAPAKKKVKKAPPKKKSPPPPKKKK